MTKAETLRRAAIQRKDRYYQEVYKQGAVSKRRAKNPYKMLNDIRAYCAWQAGVSDR